MHPFVVPGLPSDADPSLSHYFGSCEIQASLNVLPLQCSAVAPYAKYVCLRDNIVFHCFAQFGFPCHRFGSVRSEHEGLSTGSETSHDVPRICVRTISLSLEGSLQPCLRKEQTST
eukprot:3775217-Amphidinium_carterae.1